MCNLLHEKKGEGRGARLVKGPMASVKGWGKIRKSLVPKKTWEKNGS